MQQSPGHAWRNRVVSMAWGWQITTQLSDLIQAAFFMTINPVESYLFA
jgi:hypothetical protein